MATIHVDVVSAEESIFSGEAKFVALPGEAGELGILPGHTPLITRIKPGSVRIETADGGEESMCGWLKDKFGLSWQITPPQLPKMLQDPDPAKAGKAMQAMSMRSGGDRGHRAHPLTSISAFTTWLPPSCNWPRSRHPVRGSVCKTCPAGGAMSSPGPMWACACRRSGTTAIDLHPSICCPTPCCWSPPSRVSASPGVPCCRKARALVVCA